MHVDVFEFDAEREAALLNFLANFLKRLLNLPALVRREQADFGEHLGVGDRALECPAHKAGGRSSRFR